MLEINYVNLPRPHENAQVHMRAVFQLRSALLVIAARGTWGEMGGCCTSQGVTRRTSGTNGVLLKNPKVAQLTLA